MVQEHQEYVDGNPTTICELHFKPNEILRNGPGRFKLEKGALPSYFPNKARYVNTVLCTIMQYWTVLEMHGTDKIHDMSSEYAFRSVSMSRSTNVHILQHSSLVHIHF